jgi:hypothetical protein
MERYLSVDLGDLLENYQLYDAKQVRVVAVPEDISTDQFGNYVGILPGTVKEGKREKIILQCGSKDEYMMLKKASDERQPVMLEGFYMIIQDRCCLSYARQLFITGVSQDYKDFKKSAP